jgi:mono/diheme cytochrome c family protein
MPGGYDFAQVDPCQCRCALTSVLISTSLQEGIMTCRIRIVALWTAAVVFLVAGVAFQVRAETTANTGPDFAYVDEGSRLAHTLCINCHVVDTREPVVHTDRVPSFPWIARQPGLTPEFLTGWLSTSHERMPDFTLTREEIRKLTAYILSLKKPQD